MRINLPVFHFLRERISYWKIIIQKLTVYIHGPTDTGEIQNDLVFSQRLVQYCQWNADDHSFHMSVNRRLQFQSGFKNWNRSVRHFISRVILFVTVQWIMLAKANIQYSRNFENMAVESRDFQIHDKGDGKTFFYLLNGRQ